jgi:hypothetical protein
MEIFCEMNPDLRDLHYTLSTFRLNVTQFSRDTLCGVSMSQRLRSSCKVNKCCPLPDLPTPLKKTVPLQSRTI